MDRDPSQESPELSEARQKFVSLSSRFLREVIETDFSTFSFAESISMEARAVGIAALYQTDGDHEVIEAFSQDFSDPILRERGAINPMHAGAFQIIIAELEKEADKITKRKG